MQTAAQYREFAALNMNTRRLRQEMDGLFPGGWTVEDLADHLCLKKTGKHLNDIPSAEVPSQEVQLQQGMSSPIPNQTPPANPAIQEAIPDLRHDVEARYQEYLRYFQPEAPNDELDLRLLVENELTLQRLNERRLRMLEANARATDLKAIVEAITKLSDDCGRIQKRLGIDRPTRGTGQDAGDKLVGYVNKAKSVLHRQGIPIFCTACYRTDAKTLNLYGFFVWHLQDEAVNWRLEFECPRCHTKMVYTQENLADLKAMAGWLSNPS
jgi:hypothetical protein